ncbi:MAG: hypothetical protein JW727_00050 [Candidatus Aenigmarchaeota archaeon]|nr:hypothetical protein [Candidatus Aenigmarchaeota archaeon]
MTRILVFGDSIAWGAWDLNGGWIQKLRTYLEKKLLSTPEFWKEEFYQVYNLGVASTIGENSQTLLKRFKHEANARFEKDERTIFVFAIGKNDSRFLKSKNNFAVPKEDFRKNIVKLIKNAKEFSPEIIFIGTTPINDSKTSPIPWDRDASYKNEYLQEYNAILKEVCLKEKIP